MEIEVVGIVKHLWAGKRRIYVALVHIHQLVLLVCHHHDLFPQTDPVGLQSASVSIHEVNVRHLYVKMLLHVWVA